MKTLYALKDERGHFIDIFKNDRIFLQPELFYKKELAESRAKIYAEEFGINLKVVKVRLEEIEEKTDNTDDANLENNKIYKDFIKGLEK